MPLPKFNDHYLSFVITVCLTILSPLNIQAQVATIKGTIAKPQSDLVSVDLVKNALAEENESYAAYIQPDGSFIIQLPIDQQKFAFLYHAEQFLPLYLSPNCDIQLQLNTNEFVASAAVAGEKAAASQFLVDWSNTFDTPNHIKALKVKRFSKNLNEYAIWLSTTYQQQHQEFLQAFIQQNQNLPSNFEAFATCIYQTFIGNELMRFPAYLPTEEADRGDETTPKITGSTTNYVNTMANYFKTIDVNNSLAFDYPPYRRFVENYSDLLFRQGKASSQAQGFDNQFVLLYHFIPQHFSGIAEAHLQASCIIDACTFSKPHLHKAIYNDFLANCPYPNLNAQVQQVFEQAYQSANGQKAPNFTLSTSDGSPLNLTSLKGKVVYIDFWATWCGPCINEMKHAKTLRQQLAGKNVAFVYVSVDEMPMLWENMLNEQDWHLPSDSLNTFHAISFGMKTEMPSSYNVKVVPRYVLIDKNGIIADSNAKRPSELSIVNDIEALLKK